jgi:hypothetical protein
MAMWTCPACDVSSDEAFGACSACRAVRPVDTTWPKATPLVLLYPGDTQVDASQRYIAHASALDGAGYHVVATSWGEERPSAGSAFFFAHLEEAYRVGTLLVTYRKDPA